MQIRISAVIITLNEEKNIGRCIKSVRPVADEIVVVDSFSTDRTQKICESYNVRFIQHEFEGYIEQVNWAKDQAVNDFILAIDADESLDNQLQKSILEVKKNWKFHAYKMNRLTSYCGKWIRTCGWYPDTKTRLFDRRKGIWAGINPHYIFTPNDNFDIGYLKGDILHYSYHTPEDHLKQIEKFSTIGAHALFNQGKRSGVFKIATRPTAKFLKSYILKKGFLDGKTGFTISRRSAYANYLKYSKLLKLQTGKDT